MSTSNDFSFFLVSSIIFGFVWLLGFFSGYFRKSKIITQNPYVTKTKERRETKEIYLVPTIGRRVSEHAVVGIKFLPIKSFTVCLSIVSSHHPPCLISGVGPTSMASSDLISGAKTRSRRGFLRWKGDSTDQCSISGGRGFYRSVAAGISLGDGGSLSSIAAGSVFGRGGWYRSAVANLFPEGGGS